MYFYVCTTWSGVVPYSETVVFLIGLCVRACFVLLKLRIKGAEARRRITFFVNSLFVEQPKKRRVLEMPSLTTLTPYYNEDVVSEHEFFFFY